MNCRGLVVLTETHYPGWTATVDGRETAILEAFGAFRGVVVEGGEHTIEYAYRPVSVLAGAALSMCGIIAVAAICVVSRVRRRAAGGKRGRRWQGAHALSK
jgi:uncharacterized membrane protein YfhO